jgi:DNA repair protein SbcD/Mre11
MKLLHTGDWHVGKTIRGRSRSDEFRAVFTEIAGITEAQEVDVVLIAGDLFDTATPTAESEQIVYEALLALSQCAQHVVMISGNHDNHRRLAAIKPLLELTNIHVAPTVARPDGGGCLKLVVADQVLNLSLLPFVSQRGIVGVDELMQQDADEHSMAYAERLSRVISLLTATIDPSAVNVLLAHAMVHGGRLGGGERDAHTIFEYSVPTTVFPAHLHYVALGHLHRAQKLEGGCPIHYSGSILQLDFGEEEDKKSVNVIEAVPGAPAIVQEIPLKEGKRLRTVKGTFDSIVKISDQLQGDYLRVLLDEKPRIGLADEIRDLLPDAVDVRVLQHEQVIVCGKPDIRGLGPVELFDQYLKTRNVEDKGVFDLFKQLLGEEDATQAN